MTDGIAWVHSEFKLELLFYPFYIVYTVSLIFVLFFVFVFLGLIFPTIRTLCDFSVGEGQLHLRSNTLKREKEKIFLK